MSYSVSGTMITLTRGDTFSALITITDLNDNQYIPMNGDRIRFAMKNDYRGLWEIRCNLKPLRVGYFCIIPTLWLKKPVITGYFASIIETYHSLITSKSLQLRCFQSS